MNTRILKTIINISPKLNNRKTLKKSFVVSGLTFTGQNVLHYTRYHYSQQKFLDEHFNVAPNIQLPKDGVKKKEILEEIAKQKFESIIENNPEKKNFYEMLKLEIDVQRQNGQMVPEKLDYRNWLELINCKTWYRRKAYLEYLFKDEKRTEKKKMIQEQKYLNHQQFIANKKESESNEIVYSLGNNFMFRRFFNPTINDFYNWCSLKALMFGNKIIFDCSYEKYMSSREILSCAKQILVAYSKNRVHNYPFEIILCNVNFAGPLISKLYNFIPNLYECSCAIRLTSKSYLDLFDKSELVYLTSNAPHELTKYEPNSIYIIGAYVDKGPKQSVSLGIAKKEKLRMAKLPIDQYLEFGDGSGKDLTVNQVFEIMLDAQVCDWNTAMRHVPRRKLSEFRIHNQQLKIQRQILQYKNSSGSQDNDLDPFIESPALTDFSYAARLKYSNEKNG